ncbi:MAG: alpha/beta hydrolase [Chloroflexota bacterium]|jgi:pimeloyl-ACP methyl ester carboxylesterase
MRIFLTGLFVFVTLLLPSVAHPVAAQSFSAPTDCDESITIDRTIECRTVLVPLDHDNPASDSVVLPMMIVRAAGENTNAPLYLLQGGPGGDTIDTFSFLVSKLDSVLPNDRDIYFYEQRGTTDTQPSLDCPEVHQLGISLLPEDLSYTEGVDKYLVAYEQCITRLQQKGVNLSMFNSRQNALDLIYIAEQFGHDQIDLYGVSYGSLLAQHVTRLKPELIRSLVIDGIVPPNESVDARVYESRHNALEAIFSDCENDTTCASAYPSIRQTYADIMADYEANPRMWELTDPEDATVTHTARVDHYGLQGWLFSLMYDDQLVRYVPLMLTELANERTDTVRFFMSFNVFNDSIAEMMYMSTQCSEEALVPTGDYVIPADNLIPLADGELENDLRYRQVLCELSQVTPLDASFNAEFRTDVPTLIVSGRYDPITPAVFGDIVAGSVPQATHIVIPNGAHGAMLSNACAADIAKAFWANPTQTLDTSCVAEQRTQFVTADTLIDTDFISNSAQLDDRVIIDWVAIGGGLVLLILAFFGRIVRALWRLLRGQSPQSASIRQQRIVQTGVIITGIALVSYLLWQMVWLTLTYDYAIFFGIPDPMMIIRIGTWVFLGLTAINVISALRAFRQRMSWYSVVFACMIMLSSIAISVAFVRNGIY